MELDPDNAYCNGQLGAQLKQVSSDCLICRRTIYSDGGQTVVKQADKLSEALFYSHITIVSV